MLPYIPAEGPRVAVAPSGALAAIVEPARVTLVDIPNAEPFGAIETGGHDTDAGWLGARLVLIARLADATRIRVIDPAAPRIVCEQRLRAGLRLFASTEEHALLADGVEAIVAACDGDALLVTPMRGRTAVSLAGAAPSWFAGVAGDSLIELDPQSATTKRTWKVPGTVTACGGTPRSLWRTTREAPATIDVIPLVTVGQPKQHVLPAPIAHAAGHPKCELVVCVLEIGRVMVVDLSGAAPPRDVATGPIERPEAVGLVASTELHVIACQEQRPTIVVPLAMPTWRNELVAWTRSGVVTSYPFVPPIAQLVRHFEIEDELIPAVTLCYGAYLCGAPGVPADDLAELLGGRWPDEVSGNGFLAESGLLLFADGWISIAPEYRTLLDAV